VKKTEEELQNDRLNLIIVASFLFSHNST